jgi:phage terminase small subunit
MGRPSKPIKLVKGHRTKAEKEKREKEEKRLLTGTSFKEDPEVANDPIAHKEFIRLKKLFKKIDKDEGLQENVINRYCMLHSEIHVLKKMRDGKSEQIEKLEDLLEVNKIDYLTFIDKESYVINQILGIEKKIQDKRKMMLDIEKENIMTIASAMRCVPKKPEEEKETNPFENLVRLQK